MSNSIIHVGPVGQNLGTLYSDTYSRKRPKKTTTTPVENKKKKHRSAVKCTRPAFYREMARAGRRLLDPKARKSRSRQLANNYGSCAISAASILKVLDAYYYCCKGITEPAKQSAQIKSSLKSYLLRMKVDSRVLNSVLVCENIAISKKIPDTNALLTNISYYNLHLSLSSAKKNHFSSDLIKAFKQRRWSDQYISKIVQAYNYRENNFGSLKDINQKYHLGILKRDIAALDKFW